MTSDSDINAVTVAHTRIMTELSNCRKERVKVEAKLKEIEIFENELWRLYFND